MKLDDLDAVSSEASSTASPTAELDGGPEFDPAADPAPAAPIADALAGGPSWTETRVRALLTAKGELVHGVLAVDKTSTEWCYTQGDLEAIAPSLTRILNRYDATRAAAASGDELVVAIGFAGYAARSYSERRAALALARYLEENPAEPGPEPTPAHEPLATVPTVDEQLDVPPIAPRRF